MTRRANLLKLHFFLGATALLLAFATGYLVLGYLGTASLTIWVMVEP
jgi:hypothetical protein